VDGFEDEVAGESGMCVIFIDEDIVFLTLGSRMVTSGDFAFGLPTVFVTVVLVFGRPLVFSMTGVLFCCPSVFTMVAGVIEIGADFIVVLFFKVTIPCLTGVLVDELA